MKKDIRRSSEGEIEERDYLKCSVTLAIMVDPVTTVDGQTYERAAIERWFERNNTSPNTGAVLKSKDLVPNISIRQAIDQYHQDQARNLDNNTPDKTVVISGGGEAKDSAVSNGRGDSVKCDLVKRDAVASIARAYLETTGCPVSDMAIMKVMADFEQLRVDLSEDSGRDNTKHSAVSHGGGGSASVDSDRDNTKHRSVSHGGGGSGSASVKRDDTAAIARAYSQATGFSVGVVDTVFKQKFSKWLDCESIEVLTERVGDMSEIWNAVTQEVERSRQLEDLQRQRTQLEQEKAALQAKEVRAAQQRQQQADELRRERARVRRERERFEQDQRDQERLLERQQRAIDNARRELSSAGLFSRSELDEPRPRSVSRESSGGM